MLSGEFMVDILDRGNKQVQYQREKDSWQVEKHRQAAEHKKRLATRFLEQECCLRNKDGAQQKDLFERLLTLMATGFQAPALLTPCPESSPWYHVLQTKNTLDNTTVGWPVQLGLNANWTGQMYPPAAAPSVC